MDNFLLKVIDDNGIEILDDKQAFGKTHYDSLDKLSKMINISFTTRNRETMALQLAEERNLTTIFNVKVGYLFVLPENCTELLINYLENNLPLYQEEEQIRKKKKN